MTIDVLLVVAIGVVGFGLGLVYRRTRANQLADVSDEVFIKRFAERYSAPAEAVLRERRRVAKVLGIPQEKLDPEQSLKRLAKRFEYLGEFSVAWSDLDDEVRELRRSAGVDEHGGLPSTVGQLVAEFCHSRDTGDSDDE